VGTNFDDKRRSLGRSGLQFSGWRFVPGNSSKTEYVYYNRSSYGGKLDGIMGRRTKKYRSKFVRHKSHFDLWKWHRKLRNWPTELISDAFDLRTLYVSLEDEQNCVSAGPWGTVPLVCVSQSDPWFAEDTCLTTALRENSTITSDSFWFASHILRPTSGKKPLYLCRKLLLCEVNMRTKSWSSKY
jgi:hypothetical protein